MPGLRRNATNSPQAGPRLAMAAAGTAVLALTLSACVEMGTAPARDLEIIWPARNAIMIDEEVLRVRLPGWHLDDYDVYWYVDNGPEVRMWNVRDGRTPHKAYPVDTWFWDWRGRGPYTVGFIAEDRWGYEIAHRTVRVYVE